MVPSDSRHILCCCCSIPQAGKLSAMMLAVHSGSGPISLGRLFGGNINISCQGHAASIAALYSKQASIRTCGGPISIQHMSCSESAWVDSGGGNLVVQGLEGNATLSSSGGPIKVWSSSSTWTV